MGFSLSRVELVSESYKCRWCIKACVRVKRVHEGIRLIVKKYIGQMYLLMEAFDTCVAL